MMEASEHRSSKRPGSRFGGLAAALAVSCVVSGALLATVALQWRNPALVGRWPLPQFAFAVLDTAALVAASLIGRRSGRLAALALALPILAAGVAAVEAGRAQALREVFDLPSDELRPAAAHVVAGFYDMDEARALARAGVAGLFISPRNVRGRDAKSIARDIAGLQQLRREAGLPPLWIAADQEGGLVATLSPPLPRPPAPAAANGDAAMLGAEGAIVGRQLAAIGVNVNFAPVVDVTRGALDPRDRNSRIALRSLSADPEVVARGAAAYCRGLQADGIQCTIKHFPGLGAVTTDTHVAAAHRRTIDPEDLSPFRRLLATDGPHPWVMLGHLVVDDLDPSRPASASPALIGILRSALGDDGVLVTDDAAMAPYRADLAAHAVATLKGGGDLVLASWNPDVALAVIADIARALHHDPDLAQMMVRSDARLRADRPH